jgi:hypothetical protein
MTEPASPTHPAATPADPVLALPLPEGWVRCDITTDGIEGIGRFMDQAHSVLEGAGLPVQEWQEMLRTVAADRRLDDVRFAATWVHTEEDGGVVQASVAVTFVPDDVRSALADDPRWDLSTLDHPDGDTVVRRVRVAAGEPLPPLGGAAAGLGDAFSAMTGHAQYLRAAPAQGSLALVTFSSVTLGAWKHLLTLFDNLMLASRWISDEAADALTAPMN